MKKILLLLLFCNLLFSIFTLQELQVTPIKNDLTNNSDTFYIYSTIPNLRFYPRGETFEFDYVKYDSLEAVYEIYDPDITYRFTIRGSGFVEKELQLRGSINNYKVEAIPLTCVQDPGTVLINTTPAGANIYFKTRPFGEETSPFLFKWKESKINRVTIIKKNYQSVDTSFVIDANNFTVLDVTLEPLVTKTKTITDQQNTVENFTVDFKPSGSNIIINGEKIGYTLFQRKHFLTGLKKNTHYSYEISNYHYHTYTDSFYTDTLSTIKLEGNLVYDSTKYYTDNSNYRQYFNGLLTGYAQVLKIEGNYSLTLPGLIEYGEFLPSQPDSKYLYSGWGYTMVSHITINKVFWMADWLSMNKFILFETTDKNIRAKLNFDLGLKWMYEFKKEKNGKDLVYGEASNNPDGTHNFSKTDILDCWVPAEVNFSLEARLRKNIYFTINAGGWILNRSGYSPKKKWYYETDITDWKNDNTLPLPADINENIGLLQKHGFLPYIGFGIHYSPNHTGAMWKGI